MSVRQTQYQSELRWAIYGICVASLLFLLGAVYLIVRLIDSNWADWQLPTILGIVWLVLVIIGAMVFAIPEISRELKRSKEKDR